MGLVICASCVLCLFFLRDVFILGSKQEHVPRKLLLYAILMSLYLPGVTVIAYSLPEQRAIELLRSPWVWITVLTDALLSGALRRGWRTGSTICKDRMWLTIICASSDVSAVHRFQPRHCGSRG